MFVSELEVPAGGLQVWTPHAPIAAPPHFFTGQPSGRPVERLLRRVTGFTERERRDRCVPDNGETRLEEKAIAVVDEQVQELPLRFTSIGVVGRVAEKIERHD